MARIRTVKPQLFRHELLYEAEKQTGLPLRLAFVGLFTACDREGRFKWKPRELKLDVLPYDDLDFSRVLDALMTRGFIVKYALGEAEFGCIPSWHNHQVINNREAASELPTLEESTTCTREARVNDATATPLVHTQVEGKGKGREGEKEGNEEGADSTRDYASTDALAGAAHLQCPQDEIRALFTEKLPHLPQARVWGADRQKELRARWAEAAKLDGYATKEAGLAWWSRFFADFERSNIGHGTQGDGRVWVPDLQWILKRSNFEKILNGRYAARSTQPGAPPPKSFAEQDREAGMRRWEEMTGEVHPDRNRGAIDVPANFLDLGGPIECLSS